MWIRIQNAPGPTFRSPGVNRGMTASFVVGEIRNLLDTKVRDNTLLQYRLPE
jgi:hypothetical protein